MKRAKKSRASLGQTLRQLTGQPPREFYRQPILHINCQGQVEIENCRRILGYDSQCIRLDMGSWQVCLFGKNLRLVGITRQRMLLEGQVTTAELAYSGRKGRGLE